MAIPILIHRNPILLSVRQWLLLIALVATPYSQSAAGTPFNTLLGSWGGSGTMRLQDGKAVRLSCNTYYTGGGSHLGMVIRCTGGNNKIEIRSKLTNSGGRLTGNWEERTYNAEGTVSGRVTNNRITLAITGGGLSGNMSVSYGSSKQSVSITTEGIGLKSVIITLARQR